MEPSRSRPAGCLSGDVNFQLSRCWFAGRGLPDIADPLRNALLETTNFAGVTGTLTSNESGDCQPETRIAVYSIDEGDFLDKSSFATTVGLNDL
jgi:hypothetical protein